MSDLPALLSNWPYGAWAAGAATLFYAVTVFATEDLAPDRKAHLALWLKGDYDSTWPKEFGAMFDRLFGANHLKLRCMALSALASIVAVFALWLLFDRALSLISLRADTGLSLTQALLIGAAINIVPDYISLYETRWLLKTFERVRHPFGQLAILLVDLLVTGLIIYSGIKLYLLVRGEAQISFVEMAALFSFYAIFFYSTFLTSVWAWAFCLSSWLAKLSARLSTWLDVDGKPGRILARIGAVLVFLVALAVKPVFTMDDAGRVAIDDALCNMFPATACVHVARLTADEEAKLEALGRACLGGATEECIGLGLQTYEITPEKAAAYWQSACDGGVADACSNLGVLYRDGQGVSQDPDRAAMLHQRACDRGSMTGCTNLGEMYANGYGVSKDTVIAGELFQRACSGGVYFACHNLGVLYLAGEDVSLDVGRAVMLFQQACDAEVLEACINLGLLYDGGHGVAQDPARAAVLYERACAAGNMAGCSNLGVSYEYGEGVSQDAARAVALYQEACDGGQMQACVFFADMLKSGDRVNKDIALARLLYERACAAEAPYACQKLEDLNTAQDADAN
ncbi:MAG: tetratricopeptide repeat protein [Pseudomonadota bacterium]